MSFDTWFGAVLALFALYMAASLARGLRTGRLRTAGVTFRRDENPCKFRFQVRLELLFLAMLAVTLWSLFLVEQEGRQLTNPLLGLTVSVPMALRFFHERGTQIGMFRLDRAKDPFCFWLLAAFLAALNLGWAVLLADALL